MSEMNRRVFEALKREGECWHEFRENPAFMFNPSAAHVLCSCGKSLFQNHDNPDFSTWGGFGWANVRLPEKGIEVETDYKFGNHCVTFKQYDAVHYLIKHRSYDIDMNDDYPKNFFDALADFLKEEPR